MRNQFHLDSSDYSARQLHRSKPRSFSWILTLFLCLCFVAGGTLAVYFYFQDTASSPQPPPSSPLQPEFTQTTEQLYSHQQPMMEPISQPSTIPDAIQVIQEPIPAQQEAKNETPEQKEPATKPSENADQTDSKNNSDDQTRKPEKKPEQKPKPEQPPTVNLKPKQSSKDDSKPKQSPSDFTKLKQPIEEDPKPWIKQLGGVWYSRKQTNEEDPKPKQPSHLPPGEWEPIPLDKPNISLHNDLEIIFLQERKEQNLNEKGNPFFVTTQKIDLEDPQLPDQEIPAIKMDAIKPGIPIIPVNLPKSMSEKEREQWVDYFLKIAETNHLKEICISPDLEQMTDLDFSLHLFFEILRYELANKGVKLSFAVHHQNEKVQLSLKQIIQLSLLSEQVFVYSSAQNKENQKVLVLEPADRIQILKESKMPQLTGKQSAFNQ